MNPRPSSEDHLVVEQLLAETEAANAEDLRPLLEDLRSLAHAGPVEPSPAVARLLVEDAPEAPISLDVYRRSAASTAARHGASRPRGRRRTLAAAVALTAALGAGTAVAAAADPGFRRALDDGIATVVGALTGHGTPTPPPAPTVPAVPAQPAGPSSSARATAPSGAASRNGAPAGSGAPTAPATPTSGLPVQLPSPSLGLPAVPVPGASDLPQPTLGGAGQPAGNPLP